MAKPGECNRAICGINTEGVEAEEETGCDKDTESGERKTAGREETKGREEEAKESSGLSGKAC